MSNLQDQFDKREVEGFDADALWQRIERHKKRRRIHWLLFFSLLAVLLAAGIRWIIQPPETESPEPGKAPLSVFPSRNETGSQNKAALQKSIENRSLAESEKIGAPGKAQERKPRKPVQQDETFRPQAAFLPNFSSNDSIHFLQKEEPTPFSQLETPPEVGSESPLQSSAEAVLLQNKISLLSKVTFFIQKPFSDFSISGFSINHQSAERKKDFAGNRIAIAAGIGTHQPFFEGDNCDLREKEQGRLDLNLGISYRKYLSPDFFLFTSLQLAVHNSRVRYSTSSLERIIEMQDELTLIETTTSYKIYNQYQRLEVAVGAGKSWPIGSFDLALSAGLGGTTWLKVDAQYFDPEEQLTASLPAEERSPAFFGLLRASLNRELAPGLEAGIFLFGQSPLELSIDGEACEHRMLPFGGGIMIGKRFH